MSKVRYSKCNGCIYADFEVYLQQDNDPCYECDINASMKKLKQEKKDE